jgi:hypothetical protein
MWGSQLGKSQVLLAMLLYYVHWVVASVGYYSAEAKILDEFSKDRLQPSIDASPALKPLLRSNTSKRSGNTQRHKRFINGSICRLRNFTCYASGGSKYYGTWVAPKLVGSGSYKIQIAMCGGGAGGSGSNTGGAKAGGGAAGAAIWQMSVAPGDTLLLDIGTGGVGGGAGGPFNGGDAKLSLNGTLLMTCQAGQGASLNPTYPFKDGGVICAGGNGIPAFAVYPTNTAGAAATVIPGINPVLVIPGANGGAAGAAGGACGVFSGGAGAASGGGGGGAGPFGPGGAGWYGTGVGKAPDLDASDYGAGGGSAYGYQYGYGAYGGNGYCSITIL